MILYNRLFLLLISILFALPQSGIAQSYVTDSLDNCIPREMKYWSVPGAAITIVKDGKVIYCKGFGVKQMGKPGKVDENTLFMIASNTKAYTATALALLEHEKRLSIDDKVTKYMPGFKLYDTLATRDVTIRDLLCHRTGIGDGEGDFLFTESNYSRKEIIQKMRYLKPTVSFRNKFQYCNDGYIAAGEIIPAVTDTSWDDFLKYHIFQPLKMNRTTTHVADIIHDTNSAVPYIMYNDSLKRIKYDSVDNFGPCGGIISSIHDVSDWLIMQVDSGKFDSKQVIPFDAIRNTRASNVIVGDIENALYPSAHFMTYGLGWFLYDYNGHKIVFHSGNVPGFSCLTAIIPDEKIGFTILTNENDDYFKYALRNQLMDVFLNVPYRDMCKIQYSNFLSDKQQSDSTLNQLKTKLSSHPKPALNLNEYTGKFTNDAFGEIEIKVESGKLDIYFSRHPHVIGRLEPLGDNVFACIFSPIELGFKEIPFNVKNGVVQTVSIDIDDNGVPYEFKRIK